MSPTDDRPRYQAVVRLLSQALVIASSVAGESGGRLLRKAADEGGTPLFGVGEVGGKAVWVCLPLARVIRALRALTPADACAACSGAGCAACRHAGYLPECPSAVPLLPAYTALDVGPVLDVWGWVRASSGADAGGPVRDDDDGDDAGDGGSFQRTLLDLLEGG